MFSLGPASHCRGLPKWCKAEWCEHHRGDKESHQGWHWVWSKPQRWDYSYVRSTVDHKLQNPFFWVALQAYKDFTLPEWVSPYGELAKIKFDYSIIIGVKNLKKSKSSSINCCIFRLLVEILPLSGSHPQLDASSHQGSLWPCILRIVFTNQEYVDDIQ